MPEEQDSSEEKIQRVEKVPSAEEMWVRELIACQLRSVRQKFTDDACFSEEAENGRLSKEAIAKARSNFATAEEVRIAQAFEDSVRRRIEAEPELAGVTWSYSTGEAIPLFPSTQTLLGERLGVTKDVVSKWERKLQTMNVAEWIDFCRFANLDPGSALLPVQAALNANDKVIPARAGLPSVNATDWLLWVKGVAPLPGQSFEEYVVRTNLPPLSVGDVRKRQNDWENALGRQTAKEDVLSGAVVAAGYMAGNPLASHYETKQGTRKMPRRMLKLRGVLGVSALVQHLVRAATNGERADVVLGALRAAQKDLCAILLGVEREPVHGKNTGNTRMNSGEKRG